MNQKTDYMTHEEIERRAREIVTLAKSGDSELDEVCVKAYIAGADWMQNSHLLLKDVREGKALVVGKDWLDRHERNVRKLQLKEDIDKAWEWINKGRLLHIDDEGDKERFIKAMED